MHLFLDTLRYWRLLHDKLRLARRRRRLLDAAARWRCELLGALLVLDGDRLREATLLLDVNRLDRRQQLRRLTDDALRRLVLR